MDEYIGVLSLDLDCRKNLPKISVGQFDKGRKYLVNITKNGAPFSAQNSTVILQGERQDKSCFSIACSVNDNGSVTFELDDEILSVSGTAFAKLILSDSTKNYSTQIFAIDVDTYFEGTIDDEGKYSLLNDLINRLMLLFELDDPEDVNRRLSIIDEINERVKIRFAHTAYSDSYDDNGVYVDEATDNKTLYVYKNDFNIGVGIMICSSVDGGINLNGVCQIRVLHTGNISYRTGSAKVEGVRTWSEWRSVIGSGTSNAILEITEDTVPESEQWEDEIPEAFDGQGYKLALWNYELWYLSDIVDYEQTYTHYYWIRLATTDELSDLLSSINAKMSLAPINPTAAQIEAMPRGQFYSDTVNHKGVIKTNSQYPYENGQEFYDSVYINQNYERFYDKSSSSGVPVLIQIGVSEIGADVGSVLLTSKGSYMLLSTSLEPNKVLALTWGKSITKDIPTLSVLPTGGRITSFSSGMVMLDFYTGDLVQCDGKIYQCNVEFPEGVSVPLNYLYTWKEVDYYTKSEIDTMIGDIESLLSEV